MTDAPPRSDSVRREAVVFDVDGTLCDVRSIRHYVEAKPDLAGFKRNFARFHAASIDCPPNPAVKQLLLDVREHGLAALIVTGREAKWLALTIEWLTKHQIPYDGIWTRSSKDYRPDHAIKSEIQLDISRRYRILLAVDDRTDIIGVWQAAGIATAKVDDDGTLLSMDAQPGTLMDERIRRMLSRVAAK